MDPDARRYTNQKIRQLTKRVDNIAANLALLAGFVTAHTTRHIAQVLTDVPIGTSTVEVTIDPPMTSTYGVALTPIAGAALVGKLTASIQPLSKTATGFTAVLSNTTVATIASAGLDVIIVPD
jgi:hypothetical protein